MYLTVTDQSQHRLAKYPGLDLVFWCNPQNDFSLALSRIFSKEISYDYVKSYVGNGAKFVNQEIPDLVRREKPRYVLWRASTYHIQESTFHAIRERGAIVIGWFWDDHFRFDDYSRLYIPCLDYSVTNDPQAMAKYKALNARCIYAPCASTPEYCKRLHLQKNYDVSFVGGRVSNRELLINEIKDRGVSVHVFGKGWGGCVSFDRVINIFNSSKINLNFTSIGDRDVKQTKGRIFEITMCGGFLVTEHAPGLEEFFEVDKEIVCFETVEEAVDKIRYYLKHDAQRQAIANAGWRRAHCDHTWQIRLSSVFEEIERDIEANGRPNISSRSTEMTEQIRQLPSDYHYHWAKALLAENHVDLWKDELALSLTYNPSNLKARCLSIIAHFPSFMHSRLFHLCSTLEKGIRILRSRLRTNPVLRA